MNAQLTLTVGLGRKIESARRILAEQGLGAVVRTSGVAAAKWWRQGEVWELRKSPHVRLDGCRFALDARIPPPLREQLVMNLFEIHERNAIRRHLDNPLPVVEFGACMGVVACTTNRILRHPNRHVVVEANPSLVKIIRENRNRNRCEFTILNAALAYGAESVQFRVSESNPLESGSYCQSGRPLLVPTITLRDIVARYHFPRCTLICDIEGSEFDLIAREADVLRDRVALIIMEIHRRLLGDVRTEALLGELGKAGFQPVESLHDTYIFRNRRFV